MVQKDMIFNDYAALLERYPQGKHIKTVTFQVTDTCNLACTYCYQTCKKNHFMNFETAKQFIDMIFDNRTNPDFYLWEGTTAGIEFDFIGGEPTLNMDLIEQIFVYIEKRMLEIPDHSWFLFHKYLVDTNGTEYFNPTLQKLLTNFPELVEVSITLDGCKELHDKCRLYHDGRGSWDDALAAAIYNKDHFGQSGTKITLAPDNVEYTYQAIVNMIGLGFMNIHINCCYEEGWEEIHAKILYQQLKQVVDYMIDNNLTDKVYISILNPQLYLPLDDEDYCKNHCGTSDCMTALDYKGNIFSCIRFLETSIDASLREPFTIGNINQGIGITEKDKQHLSDFSQLTRRSQSDDTCLTCPIGKDCGWCTAYSYEKLGSIQHRTTYHCLMHKAGALAAMYLEIKENNMTKISFDYSFVNNIISMEEFEYIKGGK